MMIRMMAMKMIILMMIAVMLMMIMRVILCMGATGMAASQQNISIIHRVALNRSKIVALTVDACLSSLEGLGQGISEDC